MSTSELAKDLMVIQKDDMLPYDLLLFLADNPETLELYIKKYGDWFYQRCLFSLTHISISEKQSKKKWFRIVAHRKELNNLLERDAGLKVAAIDYLENIADTDVDMTTIESDKVDDIVDVATIDKLTSLYIRGMFDEMLDKEFQQYLRNNQPLSVVMIDIDDFKYFNDTYGHQKGDDVLQHIGKVLLDIVRKSDIACRYGGEELTIIMPNTDLATATEVAERVRQTIEASSDTNEMKVTVSIGVSEATSSTESAHKLVKLADDALYRAKEQGKNRVVQADES